MGIEPAYSVIGRYIKSRREHYGVTQAELADQIGLTRVSITNIEAGRQRILVHTLLDILARIDPQDPCAQINLATEGLLKDRHRALEVLAACGVDTKGVRPMGDR